MKRGEAKAKRVATVSVEEKGERELREERKVGLGFCQALLK